MADLRMIDDLDLADAALDRVSLPAVCGCPCPLTRSNDLGSDLAEAELDRSSTAGLRLCTCRCSSDAE